MLTIRALIAVTVLLLSAFAAPRTGAAGQTERASFFSAFGPLEYEFYVPEKLPAHAPLWVALHGCHQTAELFSKVTKLNALADKAGFVVLYPEQSTVRNWDGCWNWFLPPNQVRGLGEGEMIAELTRSMARRLDLDAQRIFLVGLSSGAATASILASCYSDLFAGVAIHSGLEYLAALTLDGANDAIAHGGSLDPEDSARRAFDCSGHTGKLMPTIIFHGSQDPRVAPVNGAQVFSAFAAFNDLLDDGVSNGSVAHEPTRVERVQPADGYPYTVTDILSGGRVLVRKITVEGMAHAWSGGAAGFPNSDPLGPDATAMIWDFFNATSSQEFRGRAYLPRSRVP